MIHRVLGYVFKLEKAPEVEQKAAEKTKTPTPKKEAVKKELSKSEVKEQLSTKWQEVLDKEDVPLSIAVYSKKYDETYTYSNSEDTYFATASVIKADFLVAFLHQIDGENRSVSDYEDQLLRPMIESSDNDAATTIYNAIGDSQGLTTLFADLKMDESMALADGWVFTRTTPSDQLKLLDTIFYSDDYLSKTSQDYAKELMANVDEDQQWGVPAGSKTFHLKNGWKEMGDGTWMINSIGHLGTGDDSCTMAIMSYDHPDLEVGEALLETLSKETTKILGIE